jgi:two-component system OmpR family response regulator
VLVVDDDENVLQLLATKLGRAGFAVEGAPTAASARATAAWFRPDVVVIGDGAADGQDRALLDDLIAVETPAGSPVIVVLSANDQIADIESAVAHGADDYILKPFSPRDVIHRLRVDLLRRRSREQPGL